MIDVTARIAPGEFSLRIEGHAARERDGPNIPCCAVSTVAQVALAGLQAVQAQYPEHIRLEVRDEQPKEHTRQ